MTIQIEPFAIRRVSEFTAAQISSYPGQLSSAAAVSDHAEDSVLEVFVAHQDLATGLRAKQTLDRLCHQLKLAQCFHMHLWRFELLEDSVLWREAVSNASRSDILFFSLHGNQPLPASLCHWVKHWLLLRDDRPCALVVALDESERDSESGRAVLEHLRSLAATGGIEVFPYYHAPAEESALNSRDGSYWEDSSPRAAARGSLGRAAARDVEPSGELPPRRQSCMADEDPIPLVVAGSFGAANRDWGLND